MVHLQNSIPFIGILSLFPRITAQPTSWQYHFIDQSLTWFEAQSFCRVKHTDLATVNSKTHNEILVGIIDKHVTNTWIGLTLGKTHRWLWSEGIGVPESTKWRPGEPNNVEGKEWCVEMMGGEWIDFDCAETKPFVCQHQTEKGQTQLIYYQTKKTWWDSRDSCRDKYMDLVSATSDTVISRITKMTESNSVWIGLFYDAWSWSDGSRTSFRNWLYDNNVNGKCASISPSHQGRWTTASCYEKAKFVCEGGLKVKKLILRLKVSSDVDPSTVSDDILEKLAMGLISHNVIDFNLRWKKENPGGIFKHQEPSVVTETPGC